MLSALARIIHFVLGKLGRKPVKRTFVHARNKAFHHLIGKQFQVIKTGNLRLLLREIHGRKYRKNSHKKKA